MSLQNLLEGKIDFVGQSRADNLIRYFLIASTIVAFLAGYAAQSLQVTFGTMVVAALVVTALAVPPYRTYTAHPVTWLPVKDKKTK